MLGEPLSFWGGGVDPGTGAVIDTSFGGRFPVMPASRGSSSSSVLAEAIRRGTGLSAVLPAPPDPILTVGGPVARML